MSRPATLLYRVGPEGFYATRDREGPARVLYSDPLEVVSSAWETGRKFDLNEASLLAPVCPGKIIGIGRNYVDHAKELDNPVPDEPVLFLKAPSSVIGPGAPIVLPPESDRVDFEGEIAVILRGTLCRASRLEARAAILGVTCANDVTARDLQRRDPTFARAKSFNSFCPLGPAVLVDPDLEALEVITRVDGEERQRGLATQMSFGVLDLLVYVSHMMTLEPGDVLLTGTPAGVGPLTAGQRVEVKVPGVGILENPVEDLRV